MSGVKQRLLVLRNGFLVEYIRKALEDEKPFSICRGYLYTASKSQLFSNCFSKILVKIPFVAFKIFSHEGS